MKRIFITFIAMSIFAPYIHAYPSDERETFVKSIKPIIQGTEWELSTDFSSITLIRRNCKFLYPVSLPAITDNEKWEQYSRIADYRITITFDKKLTDAEYIKLWNLQNSLNYEYLKDITPGTKEYCAAEGKASDRVKLPIYKSEYSSIYVYSTRSNITLVRPKDAQDQEEAILKLLDKQFTKYDIDILNKNKLPADSKKSDDGIQDNK